MFFQEFPKLARLNREAVITEKIDGTNAQIFIEPVIETGYVTRMGMTDVVERNGFFFAAGSRTRLITPADDNHGFARWAYANMDEIIEKLGPGRHFGEWFGNGIQRGYGLKNGDKRFALFNTHRWKDAPLPPQCCTVPVLWSGLFRTDDAVTALEELKFCGSLAVPGFMKPEGIVVYHTAAKTSFKVTVEQDEVPKGKRQ